MKKTNRNLDKTNRNILNNSTSSNSSHSQYFSSAFGPEVFVNPVWWSDTPTGVEIIELNSSDEIQDNDLIFNPAWTYNKGNLQDVEDKYKINTRDRRRKKNEDLLLTPKKSNVNINNHSIKRDCYFDIFDHNDNIDDKCNPNRPINCFTNVNKHTISSDSSSDDYYKDVEIITSNDVLFNINEWDADDSYDEEFIYDPEMNNEARSIWIYSLKNRFMLTDDEFYINVPTTDASSSSSTINNDVERIIDKSTNVNREATPIPTTFVPRLNVSLIPTLSTVTEISEVTKLPSSNESSKNMFQKPINSWFEENEKVRPLCTKEKSNNTVKWMALPLWEKLHQSKLSEDRWNESVSDLPSPCTFREIDKEADAIMNDDEINAVNDEGLEVIANKSKERSEFEDLGFTHKQCLSRHIKFDSNNKNSNLNQFKIIQRSRSVPFIELHMKHTREVEITGSMEKIDSENWIYETKLQKGTATHEYKSSRTKRPHAESSFTDQLCIKNTNPFLQSPGWGECSPIADDNSVSLHLSLRSILEERKPWYKRFITNIICCKCK